MTSILALRVKSNITGLNTNIKACKEIKSITKKIYNICQRLIVCLEEHLKLQEFKQSFEKNVVKPQF